MTGLRHRYLRALLAAGIFTLLAGLAIAIDYRLSGTLNVALLGFSQAVVGLALVLVAVIGEKNGGTRKRIKRRA